MDNAHDVPTDIKGVKLRVAKSDFASEVANPRAEGLVNIRHMYITDHGAKKCVGIVVTDGFINTIYEVGERILSNFFQMHDGDNIVALRTASRDISGMLRAYRLGSIGGPYAGPAGRIPIGIDETPWVFTVDTTSIQLERGKEWAYFVEVVLKGNNITDFSQFIEY